MLNEPKTANFQEDAVTVVIAPVAALVREGLKTLDRAKAMVSASPDIMGGAACFSGMWIPVHDLADMVTNGDTVEAVAAAYPQLTIDQVRLAAIYATAYPRRGRPPVKPVWRKAAPTASKSLRIDELPKAS